jgi:cobyrinic acid a,c-diamide synthase
MTARALIIAAPRSGAGKTTVTLAVLAALRRRGIAVRAAKAGPDYIDPAFHAAATGRPGVNLDSWAMPPALLDTLLAEAAADADILLIEAAMGLFDGIPGLPDRSGAAADLARRYQIPVLLVLDVSGQSQSAAAVARGFALHDPQVRIAAVLLNRLGSDRHRRLVADALATQGMTIAGAIPRDDTLALPERHLGLVQANEHPDLAVRLEKLADVAEHHIDLDALMTLAAPLVLSDAAGTPPDDIGGRSTPRPPGSQESRAAGSTLPAVGGEGGEEAPLSLSSRRQKGQEQTRSLVLAPNETSPAITGGTSVPPGHDFDAVNSVDVHALPPPGQRIALASDAAFTFVYPHVLERWRRAGAEIFPFSPLTDEGPPEHCDVCWLPGGYPELHAARIAAATSFRTGLTRFAQTRQVHGECGGYMVLGEGLEDAAGARHAMTGLLGHSTSFAKRRLHLGYREARLLAPCPLGAAGAVIRGHEFHYATLIPATGDEPLAELADAEGRALGPAGGRRRHVTGTFFHAIAPAG